MNAACSIKLEQSNRTQPKNALRHPMTLPIHSLIKLVGCLLMVCFHTSCQSLPERSAAVESFHDTIPWKRNQVVGLTVSLIDPQRIEYLSFGKCGMLAMTGGSVGGKVCGPLLGWRLRRGRLFMSDTEGENLGGEMYLVSLTHETLTTRRSTGELARYKVHHSRE